MSPDPVTAFSDGLCRCAANPRVTAGLVIYTVEAVEGRFAGTSLETGVELGELVRWPLVPPHWLHLPAHVSFTETNSRPSPVAGWLAHSRQIVGWGHDPDPAAGWLAHVRSVLGEAR